MTRGADPAGHACAVGALLIWTAWILFTGYAVRGSAFGPGDLALARYAVPAVLLAPVLIKGGLWPKEAKAWQMAAMTMGWGAPFVLYGAEGLKTASAAEFGALVPGTMPIWAILMSWFIFHAPLQRAHIVGAALMAAGAILVLAPELADPRPGALKGYALLLVMSVSWAGYTVSFRRSGLTPLAATAYVSAYSTVAMGLWALAFGTAFTSAPMDEVLWNLASQGLLSGLVSVVLFSEAIRRLGAPQAAAFTALVPVLAAVGGWTLLGEPFLTRQGVAVALASLGVAAVNGVFDAWLRPWPSR